jgi:hypothetical protein
MPPSSSVCSLKTIPSGLRPRSFDSLALRSASGSVRAGRVYEGHRHRHRLLTLAHVPAGKLLAMM